MRVCLQGSEGPPKDVSSGLLRDVSSQVHVHECLRTGRLSVLLLPFCNHMLRQFLSQVMTARTSHPILGKLRLPRVPIVYQSSRLHKLEANPGFTVSWWLAWAIYLARPSLTQIAKAINDHDQSLNSPSFSNTSAMIMILMVACCNPSPHVPSNPAPPCLPPVLPMASDKCQCPPA